MSDSGEVQHEFDEETYRPTIDAILSVADLEQVSVKRIRRAIQELFVVDFESDKKQINDLILERYHWLMDERERLKSMDEMRKKRKMEEEDAKLAAELQGEGRGGRRKAGSAGPKAKPKKKRAPASPSSTSISAMELNLSPKLQALLGQARLPRTQVVKQVWDYIKANDLQNPEDKREILCDDKMSEVFGKKTTMFTMNKALSAHLYKDDE